LLGASAHFGRTQSCGNVSVLRCPHMSTMLDTDSDFGPRPPQQHVSCKANHISSQELGSEEENPGVRGYEVLRANIDCEVFGTTDSLPSTEPWY